MSTEEEVKWMTRKWSWKYIPDRYQAMVATIVSAFLYYNVFELFFNPINSASGACGTLLRPVIDGEDQGEIIRIVSDNVTIDGLFIINVGTSYTTDYAAIRVVKSENFLIQNVVLEKLF